MSCQCGTDFCYGCGARREPHSTGCACSTRIAPVVRPAQNTDAGLTRIRGVRRHTGREQRTETPVRRNTPNDTAPVTPPTRETRLANNAMTDRRQEAPLLPYVPP